MGVHKREGKTWADDFTPELLKKKEKKNLLLLELLTSRVVMNKLA